MQWRKNGKIGIHGEKMRKTVFGIWPSTQCFILFGFGQEFSFWCIPTRYLFVAYYSYSIHYIFTNFALFLVFKLSGVHCCALAAISILKQLYRYWNCQIPVMIHLRIEHSPREHLYYRSKTDLNGDYGQNSIQCPPLILAPLVNTSKGGCENKSALFILFIFHSKNSQNSNLSLK